MTPRRSAAIEVWALHDDRAELVDVLGDETAAADVLRARCRGRVALVIQGGEVLRVSSLCTRGLQLRLVERIADARACEAALLGEPPAPEAVEVATLAADGAALPDAPAEACADVEAAESPETPSTLGHRGSSGRRGRLRAHTPRVVSIDVALERVTELASVVRALGGLRRAAALAELVAALGHGRALAALRSAR